MIITDFGVAIVEGDSHLSKWIVEQRRLDVQAEYCRLFQKYIPVGGVVVDVGACLGDHTLSYAEMVGLNGTVFAFEPNPIAVECLRYNMKAYPQVRISDMALGMGYGVGSIQLSEAQPDNLGATQVRLFHDGKDRIAIVPLDAWPLGTMRVHFMKIDCEGMELSVLAGAARTIALNKPVMLIELNRPIMARRGMNPDALLSGLKNMGYSVQPSEPHHSLDQPELDVLALPL